MNVMAYRCPLQNAESLPTWQFKAGVDMRRSGFVGCAIVAAMISTSALADTVTVGSGTNNNTAPFGGKFTSGDSGTYQQVYAASDFSASPIAITGLSFLYGAGSPDTPSSGTYNLSLSTTSKMVNGLSLTDFASNIGADNKQVFSGTLAPQSSGNVLSFNFAGFNYDPSQGNLLLNVTVNGVESFASFFVANDGDSGGVYSRATDFVIAGFDNYGLQTTFTYSSSSTSGAVPEPASWAMMIFGMGAVGYTLRRRRARVALA